MKLFYDNVFKNYFILTITLFLEEIIFRLIVSIPLIDWALLRIFVGINILSLLLSILFSFLGRTISNILSTLAVLIISFYCLIESGFNNYLGIFMSIKNLNQLGSVEDYIIGYFKSFNNSFIFLFIPFILCLLFYIFFDKRILILENNETIDFADKFDSEERKKLNDNILIKNIKKRNINGKINATLILLALIVVYYYLLSASFMQNDLQLKSTKELFKNPDISGLAMNQFGATFYSFIDIKSSLFPDTKSQESPYDESYSLQEQVISDYIRYINDDIWQDITKKETNLNYKRLNNYFISQEITDKNDYTGIFEDKNLIIIMAESINNIAINEAYFPNIYKLYNDGWSWNNFYSPRSVCSSGNNEIIGMTALFTINNICTANVYKNNNYSESIFNLFNKAKYNTSSYHNYTEQFYSRSAIHNGMGSGHYYSVQELGIPYSNSYNEWPSDIELIEKVLEITKDDDKFMAWITTSSTNLPYTEASTIGDKNLDFFVNSNYNTSLKRYLSKLKELDNAIGTLLDGLESQGKLNDTVIVLYGSHYPYGLDINTINSYLNTDLSNNYERDKTPFIIYNTSIQGQKFDMYSSPINIVPTIANLFNLDYDPRLYAGKDVLSKTYDNRVIFADGSWKDKKAFYNATTSEVTYVDKNDAYKLEELKNIINDVNEKISMSNLAIKINYYNYLKNTKDKYTVENVTN